MEDVLQSLASVEALGAGAHGAGAGQGWHAGSGLDDAAMGGSVEGEAATAAGPGGGLGAAGTGGSPRVHYCWGRQTMGGGRAHRATAA